ncbi:MAG: TonB-dependent receptor [Gammaproteobacteria bacterium]
MTTDKNGVPQISGRALVLLAALVAGSGIPVAVQAQEDDEGSVQGLQEVVVTTRRREENLKDVPLPITAFSSETIEKQGISNLGDVANLTPGLSFFNALGENLPVPVIRGIVPQDIFGVNAAAIFVDGVYLAGREGLNAAQLDLDRIEVVKGPQSAMYGRNAFSGAINFISKRPTEEFESVLTGEYGNRGKQRLMGVVSGPILGESLLGRVAAQYDEWDGSYDNTEPGGGDIGGYRYRSLKGSLLWTPAETVEVYTGLYYSNDRIDESATAALPTNCEDQVETTPAHAAEEPYPRLQNYCGEIPSLENLPDALDPLTLLAMPGSITSDSMPKVAQATGEERELTRGNLNVDWDVGFGSVAFLTGYSRTEQSSVSDFSRSAGNGLPFLYCENAQTAFAPANCPTPLVFERTAVGFVDRELGSTVEEVSQEIRFESPEDERLRLTAGAYYFNVDQKNFPGGLIATRGLPAPIDTIGLGAVPGGTKLAIGSYIFGPSFAADGTIDPLERVISEGTTESWSLFGAVDYNLTDAWKARGEIRLAKERQESTSYTYNNLCANPLYYQVNPNVVPVDRNDPNVTAAVYNNYIVTSNPYNPAQNYPYGQTPSGDCGNGYWDLNNPDQGFDLAKDEDGYYIPGSRQAGRDAETGSARFETVTGRLSLDYQFESGWMAYGSVAWGQKPGGLQVISADIITPTGTATEEFTNTFDPEKITAYELGIKGLIADGRIGLDLAMFYNDWTDIVLRQLTETSPGSGAAFVQPVSLNINAGDADVWGWEMTTDFQFTENLTGRVTASWVDSVLSNARQATYSLFPSFYTKDPTCTPAAIGAIVGSDDANTADLQELKGLQCQAISGDVSGSTALRQPEWTASATLEYEHPLPGNWSNWDWYMNGLGSYTGKIYVGNDNQSWLPEHTYVNARMGVRSERYTVELWVDNLFDNDDPTAAFRDIYWTNTSDVTASQPPTHSNFDDFPPLRYSVSYPSLRTFGVLARMRFGAAVK